MKRSITLALTLLLAVSMTAPIWAAPLGNGFTYQGKLTDDCCPATGFYDLVFKVFDSAGPGTSGQQGSTLSLTRVPVTNGLFTVSLDFGGDVFVGAGRWLQIGARGSDGAEPLFTLLPRTELTATPNALYAKSAGSVAVGGVTPAALAPSPVANQVLSFNGSGLQWVNANSGAFKLPYSGSLGNSGSLFTLINTGTGPAISASSLNTDFSSGAILAEVPAGINTGLPSALRAINHSSVGYGLLATHEGDGYGVYGHCNGNGVGVFGNCNGGNGSFGVVGFSQGGTAILGNTVSGNAGVFLGKVGIGTASPAVTLDVLASQATAQFVSSAATYGSVIVLKNTTGSPSYLGAINFEDANGTPGQIAGLATDGLSFRAGGDERMRIGANGNIGWGASNLSQDQGGAIELGNSLGSGNVPYIDFHYGVGFDQDYNVRIINDAAGLLTVNGDFRITRALTIMGGADLAEPFQMSGKDIPKGALVVIDEENPGRLKKSERAYDTRVAGIVSGANGINPGISLHQDGALEGSDNVALSGRVFALADASEAPIKPGDLLTTSATPGHAMKVMDHAQAQGAIIGKAMSSLEKGKGMVLVLVSLQ